MWHSIFYLLSQNGLSVQLRFVLCDFEIAALKSIRLNIPDAHSKGCMFHFGQNIWRRVQSLGHASLYNTSQVFLLAVKSLVALAFLKEDKVQATFTSLRPTFPSQGKDLIKYFSDWYVHDRQRHFHTRTATTMRFSTLFPIPFWNVYDLNELCLPRTQNTVEAWHRQLKCLLGGRGTNLQYLLHTLVREQHRVDEFRIRMSSSCIPSPKKRKLINRHQRFETVLQSREEYTAMEFVRTIARFLKM